MNKINGILVLLFFVCVGTALLNQRFLGAGNIENNLRWTAEFAIIGIGVAFVIITGGIDLSIGSVIGLIGCVLVMALTEWRLSIPAVFGLLLLISLAIGLYHGFLITKLKLQPFIVTLCGLLYFRGLARWLTKDQTPEFGSTYDATLRQLALGKPCSAALLTFLTGCFIVGACLWLHWQALRGMSRHRQSAVRIVAAVTGICLIAAGSARYWYGWTIEVSPGAPLLSLGAFSIPAWSVVVPDAALKLPQQVLLWCGWAVVIPGILWLLLCLIRTGEYLRMIAPVVALSVTAGLVWWSTLLVRAPSDWFWPDAGWAQTWRILAVFGTLGCLMAAIGWFIRNMREATGDHATAPILLTAVGVIAWLIGETPLGELLVPAPMIILIVLGILASVFLNQTIYGRYLLALGLNEEAARYSGINTQAMIIVAYLLCSLAAGVGGVLFALDLKSIQPAGHGNFYELYAIAAAVLGGCSLRGGEGTILGVVVGAAILQVLRNSINLVGIPSKVEFAVIGLVILLGVIADELTKRMAARRNAVAQRANTEHAIVPFTPHEAA